MKKGFVRYIKLIVTVVIAGGFLWFLVLSPMIYFHKNEKTLEDAAKRYFELNSDKLPTGERVKTLSLNALYKESYLKDDFKAPYSGKICSLENSWVKVKKVNGEYTYYTFLDCGILKSAVDHKGPEIKLNGDNEIIVNVGDEYKDTGVSSVVDDNDGKIDVKNVTIKNNVDTKKVGTYEVTYTAFDSLSNKTVVTRVVKVVKMINGVVKNDLGDSVNYVGTPLNNYVRFSNMLFRIYGVDDNSNVILVSNEDISNVNYSKLEKWLDEVFYNHLTDNAKNMIVKAKFCNMNIKEADLDTTQCTSYTDKRYAYVPSIIDVNKAEANGENYMKPSTISWVGNSKDNNNAYVTRNVFFGDEYGKSFLSYDNTFNYGVRPKIVIKGKTYITGGDGTIDNPYVFGEVKKAKGGSLLNKRFTGEFVTVNGTLWRIIEIMEDGTTKVISASTIKDNGSNITYYPDPEKSNILYDPKDKGSVAYFINNNVSKNVDTSKLVNHEIEVPIYKKKLIYGTEVETKKYKAVLSAPNMYEMFSAQTQMLIDGKSGSYWLTNSSKAKWTTGVITDIGVPVNEKIEDYYAYGVRVVGYIKNDVVISSGDGTEYSPYKIK